MKKTVSFVDDNTTQCSSMCSIIMCMKIGKKKSVEEIENKNEEKKRTSKEINLIIHVISLSLKCLDQSSCRFFYFFGIIFRCLSSIFC